MVAICAMAGRENKKEKKNIIFRLAIENLPHDRQTKVIKLVERLRLRRSLLASIKIIPVHSWKTLTFHQNKLLWFGYFIYLCDRYEKQARGIDKVPLFFSSPSAFQLRRKQT
ncbi:MAG TPA: hypothetical protein VII99_00630 [Bacteroidia bacterium]